MERRPVSQLVNLEEPAWPLVQEWVASAKAPVEVLPKSERAEAELETLQVTTRSPMGAIAYESGGLLLDGGWLKVLGASHPRSPFSISGLTRALGLWPELDGPPALLVVGVDVLGGMFAVDGGSLGAPGSVHYLAPDDPEWMDCEQGYSGWLGAALDGGLADFYAELRWSGWERELAALAPDQGISIVPPPWTEEGKNIGQASRRAVPLAELMGMLLELSGTLGAAC